MDEFDPVTLIGPPQVADRLDIARKSAIKIIEAGLAGNAYTDGQRLLVAEPGVESLAKPVIKMKNLPPAFIVRVGPPQADGSDPSRRFYGWHAQADATEQREGIRRAWPARDASRLAGTLFVATIAGFVVHVARIAKATPDLHVGDGRWAFTLDIPAPDDSEAGAFKDSRIETTGGGIVIRHRLSGGA